jgi:hypothetical protein
MSRLSMLDKPFDLEKLVLQMQGSISELQQTMSTVLATNGKQHDEIQCPVQSRLRILQPGRTLE